MVKSNLNLPDSDRDGLPDFIERDLRTNPNNRDTDGDGLSDFDEMTANNFERFFGLNEQFPGFSVDGASSAKYGTYATQTDSDGDLLSDYDELLVGYTILLQGESSLRQIFTNPLTIDTDYDGRTDYDEMHRTESKAVFPHTLTVPVTLLTTSGLHTFAAGSIATSSSFITDGGSLYFLLTPITIPLTVFPIPTDATDSDTDNDGSTDGQEFLSGGDPLVPDLVVTVKLTQVVSNGIDEKSSFPLYGSVPTELGWWFTTKGPNDANPVLLSDATDQNQLSTVDSYFTGTAACQVIEVISTSAIAVNYNFDTSGERKVILRQGESFSLNGVVASPFILSNDCGQAPRYIPTTIVSLSDCIGNVNETFSFEDFIRGTSGQQTTVSTNTLGCDINVIYQISAQ